MAIAKKFHNVTIGTRTCSIKVPDYYGNNGSTIESATGLTAVSATTTPGEPESVGKLVANAQLTRVKISYIGGTPARRRTANILCDTNLMPNALVTLTTKKFKGADIKTAYVPRQRRVG